jgi:hypothetical protein
MSRLAALTGLAGVAVSVAVVAGCSETVSGTPQADPAQTGIPLSPDTTTSTRPSRTSGPAPSTSTAPSLPGVPGVPGGTAPADVTTTCADYGAMDAQAKLALMKVLGQNNLMIEQDPQMWVSVTEMLCSVASPTALVKDVVMGKM